MCNLNDTIQHINVLSKSYLLPNDKSGEAIKDFVGIIAKMNFKPTSLPFYTLEATKNEQLFVKVYIAIKENFVPLDYGIHYDSYFEIFDMASTCVVYNPEENLPLAYSELDEFMKKESLRAITPVFHVMAGDSDLKYTLLKVGYAKV